MMQENVFSYTYSAPKNQEVLDIRKKYLPQQERKLPYDRFITTLKEVMTMNNNDQEILVQKIRAQYTEQPRTDLEILKELDAKVKRPAYVFAFVYGSLSAIVMGAGMSLVMTEIGALLGLVNTMVPGIAVGLVGVGMALSTYPIYQRILNSRKKKYAPEVLKLSEKLMHG